MIKTPLSPNLRVQISMVSLIGRSDKIRTCDYRLLSSRIAPFRSHYSSSLHLRQLRVFRPRRHGLASPWSLTLGPGLQEVAVIDYHTTNRKGRLTPAFSIGRSDKIRTCDLLVPNQAHYQTVPHPVLLLPKNYTK